VERILLETYLLILKQNWAGVFVNEPALTWIKFHILDYEEQGSH